MKPIREDLPGDYRGIIFNLLFSLYALTLGSYFARAFSVSMTGAATRPLLAFLLLAASLSEAFALRLKIGATLYWAGRERELPEGVHPMMLVPLFFRFLLGLFLAAAFHYLLMGPTREKTLTNYAALFLSLILMVKEMYVLFSIIFPRWTPRPRRISRSLNYLADFSILTFACLSFTVITQRGFLFVPSPSGDASNPVIMLMMFTWGLVSVRAAYVLKEFLSSPGRSQKAMIVLSTLAAGASAVFAYYRAAG